MIENEKYWENKVLKEFMKYRVVYFSLLISLRCDNYLMCCGATWSGLEMNSLVEIIFRLFFFFVAGTDFKIDF